MHMHSHYINAKICSHIITVIINCLRYICIHTTYVCKYMCVMFCFYLHTECLVIEGKSEKRDSLTTKTDTTSSDTSPSSQSSSNSMMYNIVFAYMCINCCSIQSSLTKMLTQWRFGDFHLVLVQNVSCMIFHITYACMYISMYNIRMHVCIQYVLCIYVPCLSV